ncbi:MAG: hypothetical protein IPH08_20130 [Rhodocyclaceae bacterium]|nr:hypothetical protein [Rhodocyclaceae bacterium]
MEKPPPPAWSPVVWPKAELDPTFVIGGRLNSAGANARLGSGDFWSPRPMESDASFLFLSPVLSRGPISMRITPTPTNVFLAASKSAFVGFIRRLPFYVGVAVVCNNVERARIIPRDQAVITYGARTTQSKYRAGNIVADGNFRCALTAYAPTASVEPPVHHAQSARPNTMCSMRWRRLRSLRKSALVTRRLSRRWPSSRAWAAAFNLRDVPAKDGGGFRVIDRPSPVEMAATLAAARGAFPGKRLVLAFQPHRYSRRVTVSRNFVRVLSSADAVVLGDRLPRAGFPIVCR